MVDLAQARAAKDHLRSALAANRGPDRGGVRGIGLARTAEGYCVQVNVDHGPHADIPGTVDGVPVRVRVVGRVTPR